MCVRRVTAAYNALGQLELALDSFTAALEVNPSFYVSWRGKVDTLMQLGRFADAVTAITSALALKPDDMALVTKRGFAYLKLGQPEAAIGEYEAAIAAGDASPETKRLLAAAFSQRALELDKADNVAEAERYVAPVCARTRVRMYALACATYA
ncbi:tetratricopeptide repeat protein, partial [archaeon]